MKINKIDSIAVRFVLALTLMMAFVTFAEAKKNSVKINDRDSSGFNALNHVLQKPLDNPSFPEGERGFGRHLYFGLNGGGSIISNDVMEDVNPGYKFGAHFGGWFSPVHGIRLTGTYGKYSKNSGNFDVKSVSFRADYMMNLTSLLRGFSPDRKFELLGAAGLIYNDMRQHGSSGGNFGLAVSLQPRFNLNNSFYLFIEPEAALLAGPSGNRLYTDLSLSVGLGYNILTGRQRQEGSTVFYQSAEDNIFYGLAGGLVTFNEPGTKMNSLIASAFFGKMFSSTSGLQLTGRFGRIHKAPNPERRNLAIGSLDYVLNMSNAFSGYRPDNVFQLLLNVGPSAAMVENTHSFYAGIHGGLTGLFRLSDNWGIFVSPQVYSFSNVFYKKIEMGNRPLVSLDLGLRYTVGDFSRRFKSPHFTQSDTTQCWFFNAAVGGGVRFRLGQHPIYDVNVGVGRRFTPVSSWRLNIEGEYMSHYGHVTANIDYLSSMTTAMLGYKENRFFDFQTVMGVFVGGAKHFSPVRVTLGAKAGFQANFRLKRNLGLYLEPQILAVYGPYREGLMIWAPDTRMQIGVKYNW